MSKIDKSESNLYPISKGANVLKTGAVYINNCNYRVEPKDGRKPYVSHIKLCIGKVCAEDTSRFYANDNYKRKYLSGTSEENDSSSTKAADNLSKSKSTRYKLNKAKIVKETKISLAKKAVTSGKLSAEEISELFDLPLSDILELADVKSDS